MRLIRYKLGNDSAWGSLDGDKVRQIKGSVYGDFQIGDKVGRLSEICVLPPCEPSKVIALAYNYKDLVGDGRDEFDEPLIFLKSPSSIILQPSPIVIPPLISRVWVEIELAFVVRQEARFVPADQAAEYILGYTIANDVTALNVFGRDHHLARSKGLDTFCPVGPWLENDIKTDDLFLTTIVNGQVTQSSSTRNRILDDAEALSLISQFITLAPGDLVLTGTPAGAMDSIVQPGDCAELSIAGLGKLTNPIVAGGGELWREIHIL